MDELNVKLLGEQEKNSSENDEVAASLKQDISLVRDARNSDQATIDDLERQINDKELYSQNQRAARDQVSLDAAELAKQIGRLETQKSAFELRIQSKWNIYGTRIQQVIRDVGLQTWTGSTPIGPIGDFVELLDQSWHVAVKAAIGSYMTAWIVGHVDDRRLLNNILRRHGK